MKFRFRAKIKNHFFEFKNLPYVKTLLTRLEGKDVVISVDKPFNKRTGQQNNYYWFCMDLIAESTGHTAKEIHKIMKSLFAKRKDVKLNGKVYRMPISTTEMSVGEFFDYMLQVGAEVATMGITLPDPQKYQEEIWQ